MRAVFGKPRGRRDACQEFSEALTSNRFLLEIESFKKTTADRATRSNSPQFSPDTTVGLCQYKRILAPLLPHAPDRTTTMALVKHSGSEADDQIIKPEAVTPNVNTSDWPLLLKNWDRRMLSHAVINKAEADHKSSPCPHRPLHTHPRWLHSSAPRPQTIHLLRRHQPRQALQPLLTRSRRLAEAHSPRRPHRPLRHTRPESHRMSDCVH